jgi:hypothetical protein
MRSFSFKPVEGSELPLDIDFEDAECTAVVLLARRALRRPRGLGDSQSRRARHRPCRSLRSRQSEVLIDQIHRSHSQQSVGRTRTCRAFPANPPICFISLAFGN